MNEIIEELNEFLQNSDKETKKKFLCLILDKYPDLVCDKGTGCNVYVSKMKQEFLQDVLSKIKENSKLEFWQTLI
tara:strand:+ start:138 stop:362 length:225 start_codon:yes stop_codon:yes gene_type:complete